MKKHLVPHHAFEKIGSHLSPHAHMFFFGLSLGFHFSASVLYLIICPFPARMIDVRQMKVQCPISANYQRWLGLICGAAPTSH